MGSEGGHRTGVFAYPYDEPMKIEAVPFDHPHAVELTALLQQEYIDRYGEVDSTPTQDEQFAPPLGCFLVGYDDDGEPVACGGWRTRPASGHAAVPGDAELKRMFVSQPARGRGRARSLLAALEDAARAAGRLRMVLETGQMQPEAIALYRSCGYTEVTAFGLYRDDPLSLYLGKAL